LRKIKKDDVRVGEVIDELPSVDDVKLPSGVPNLKKYIINNKERIKYQEFIEKGYLIGSCAVESGHKGILQQRLKQAGSQQVRLGGTFCLAVMHPQSGKAVFFISFCISGTENFRQVNLQSFKKV
jgi:hypothetical protein